MGEVCLPVFSCPALKLIVICTVQNIPKSSMGKKTTMASKSLKTPTNRPNSSANSVRTQFNQDARKSKFWGLCCESGKKYSQILQEKIHITMAALDPTVVSTSVISLMVDSSVEGDAPYILCNLKNGSVFQVNLNLMLDKGERVTFSLRGHGQVHLSGYHIFDKDESLKSDSVEKDSVSPSKPQALFKNKSKDEALPIKTEKVKEDTIKDKSTNVKKTSKGNTKLEIELESDDDSEDDEDLDEDDESEEESTDDDRADLKKDSEKLKCYKRLRSSLNPSDSEDNGLNSAESEEDNAKVSCKKLKSDISISSPSKKNTPLKSAEMTVIDKDEPKSSKKTPKAKNALLNSSIGNTPMPKNNPKVNLLNELSPKKVSFDGDEESSGSDNEMDISCGVTPDKQGQLTPPVSESKKKKKKKKKAALNSTIDSNATPNKVANTGLAAATYSHKLPGGVEYEDIRPGNGPLAKKGRLIHVYYTGMLENNKVFDSRERGNKPFSFKLGAEQVIKGWELAIEGMKVGGKRRMKIPPSFGYKNQRTGNIPPNSTLYFNVELKAVS